ncbi:HlyD family efflux transporter periplasmic adaptor subunit [Carnobacterium sp.]|uniref:efflux RND transporter periplasmic adaptor subunit n=1 Tax=Carnobacterium sp. TaxID=48221 RepID=UPI0028ABD680|nr:HlyD family efflux transporter periplasmic adaptor subunit [Carnobacterium sp.]
MKKKIGIGLGVLLVVVIGGLAAKSLFFSNEEVTEEVADPYGIDYFVVPGMDQVFVNGTVKPEQSQEFRKEESLGTMGDLQVENGETVEKGTLLYTYENTEVAAQLNDFKNQAARMETQRSNAIYKRDLAIQNWQKLPEEERTQTLEELKIDMSTADLDAEVTELYNNIESLKEQRFKDIVAPFSGKVYIPEVKDAESPILKLISDNFYVAGTVNEKDVGKLAAKQTADIKVISNNHTVTGKVNFIDLNPAEEAGDGMGSYGGQESMMSSYPVKLSLDTLDGIRNGYHVQAIVNIGEATVNIPTIAIHQEDDQSYVLVNDFGTVVRRVIQLGKEEGENTVVTSGLEAEDQIIVSSQVEIEEGQVLSESLEQEAMDSITIEE